MSGNIPFSSQPKKAFHERNGSDELDVFEATRYFSGASESFTGTHKSASDESRNLSNTTQKYCMRPSGRMSLDMPKGNPIPLQAMLLENPIMINQEKKSKQPSSPGGKLAHFLNSLFNQTSSKKSKSKTKSTKDEDESPSGWRRKRRSSISHFRSSSTTTIMHDSKSLFSTSSSSGFRTPPTYQEAHTPTPTPTKTSSYRDQFKSYSYLKPPPSKLVTKAPINGNFNKIDNANHKCDFIEKNTTFGNGFVEKVKMFDEKQEDHCQPHNNKCILNEDTQEFKRFIDEDDGDSDSSSDLFELSNYNCDLGYCSNGLPVFETTDMHSIKRGAPISS